MTSVPLANYAWCYSAPVPAPPPAGGSLSWGRSLYNDDCSGDRRFCRRQEGRTTRRAAARYSRRQRQRTSQLVLPRCCWKTSTARNKGDRRFTKPHATSPAFQPGLSQNSAEAVLIHHPSPGRGPDRLASVVESPVACHGPARWTSTPLAATSIRYMLGKLKTPRQQAEGSLGPVPARITAPPCNHAPVQLAQPCGSSERFYIGFWGPHQRHSSARTDASPVAPAAPPWPLS